MIQNPWSHWQSGVYAPWAEHVKEALGIASGNSPGVPSAGAWDGSGVVGELDDGDFDAPRERS